MFEFTFGLMFGIEFGRVLFGGIEFGKVLFGVTFGLTDGSVVLGVCPMFGLGGVTPG